MEGPNPASDATDKIDLQTDRPHSARIYDYFLGGKDNFAADRAAAEQAMTMNPSVRIAPLQNRAFLRRAITFLADDAGVRQFLDIGTGIPTEPNVHQIAQSVDPTARVVYTDNDPIVLAHARALLTGTPEGKTAYIDADTRDVDAVLADPNFHDTLDLTRPVGLTLLALLHFIPDDDDPYAIVSRLLDALPSGSYMALSHLTGDFDAEVWAGIIAAAHQQGVAMQVRSRTEIERFFDGLEMVEPGLVSLPLWRPETASEFTDAQVSVYGGVARKP